MPVQRVALGQRERTGEDDAERSVHQLGLDSLLAMELRNRMLAELDLEVPLERLVQGGTVVELAADIVHSSISRSWTAVGQLAAIAVIRTVLNYFLEADIEKLRKSEEVRLA